MLRSCIHREVLHHLASFRFWVGTILTVVLGAASTWVAARDYELRWSAYRDRVEAHQRQIESASVYSFLQPVLVRPPEPLSVFDQGFETRLGTDVSIHLFAVPAEAAGGSRGNELLVALPASEVDLTTIVAVVLGLLALLLACEAVVGEREEGTLRMVLAQGASRRTLLAGKVLGGLLTLYLPLAAALLVCCGVLAGTVGPAAFQDRGLRIAALLASYMGYLALMFLIGLLVSLLARSSSQALVASVLLWLVTVIVIPAAAWAVAADLVDTQEAASRAAARSRELAAEEKRKLATERARHPLRRDFTGHMAISYMDGPHRAVRYRNGSAAYYEALRDYYQAETESGVVYAGKLHEVRQRYEDRLRKGERLGSSLAVVSPAFLLDRLSETLSGTSLADHDDFLAACRAYRLTFMEYLVHRGAFRSWRWFTDDLPDRLHPWPELLGLRPEDVDATNVRDLFNRLSSAEVARKIELQREEIEADPQRRLPLAELPRFAYRGRGFLERLRSAVPEGLALLLLITVTAVAAWARFERYALG